MTLCYVTQVDSMWTQVMDNIHYLTALSVIAYGLLSQSPLIDVEISVSVGDTTTDNNYYQGCLNTQNLELNLGTGATSTEMFEVSNETNCI